jgi:hypothetical protein
LNKQDRKRMLNKHRMRSLRIRTAEKAKEQAAIAYLNEEWAVRPTPTPPIPQKHVCIVCFEEAHSDICGKWYCGPHGANASAASALPALSAASAPAVNLETAFSSLPAPSRERNLFDPASDPHRPGFWSVLDPNPKPIEIHLDPLTVARSNRTRPSRPDPGIVFTEADGHRNLAAEAAEMEERKWKDTGR